MFWKRIIFVLNLYKANIYDNFHLRQEKNYSSSNRIIIHNTRKFETIGYLNTERTGLNYSEKEGQDWNIDVDIIKGLLKKIKPDRNIYQKSINRPIYIKRKT